MNSSISFANSGVTVSATSLSSSPILQGGDTINIFINISDYTLQDHSSACQAVNLKGVLLLPLFLQLISLDKYSHVKSNHTNCTPALNVSQSNTAIDINAFNVTWTSNLSYSFKVLSTVPPSSYVEVTGQFFSKGNSKTISLAKYPTSSPKNLVANLLDTSVSETPNNELVPTEYANIGVSFTYPSVTTDIDFIVRMPKFSNNVYMAFVVGYTKLTTMSNGISSSRYDPGTSPASIARPGYNEDAVFELGSTTSTTRDGSINFNIRTMPVALQPYVPYVTGNVTFEVEFKDFAGNKKILGPVHVQFKLSQPYLDIALNIIKAQPISQAYDNASFNCTITNPHYATESVDRPKVMEVLSYVNYSNTTTFCDPNNNCTEIHPSISLK